MTSFTRFTTFLIAITLYLTNSLSAADISGVVVDQATGQPLIGVTVIIKGTTRGISTDVDGSYSLTGVEPASVLQVSYISYKTIETEALNIKADATLERNFSLESDDLAIEGVQVIARKNLESESVLQNERILASFALENIGAKEMSIKGISNASEGVKKLSSVTESDAGQIFVRGLGDRYSLTTLNGLPIASPNANNKLISLNLFPSSIIKNITVSKVYNATSFADYSGARIDIGTKESTGEDFLSVSFSTGGELGTVFNKFYSADNAGVFDNQKISSTATSLNTSTAFTNYLKANDIFGTTYDISTFTAIPDFSATVSGGKTWELRNSNKLSLLASVNAGKSNSSTMDKESSSYDIDKRLMATKTTDSWSQNFKTTALVSLGYSYGEKSRISLTSFYTRSLKDTYGFSLAWDDEADYGVSNSSREINALLTNQIAGIQRISNSVDLHYAVSYSNTSSDEPDRRQITYNNNGDGTFSLSTSDLANTNRYFTELSENEIIGNLYAQYNYGDKNSAKLGVAYKNKSRDYSLAKYTYNLRLLDAVKLTRDELLNADDYVNYSLVQSGQISVTKYNPATSTYSASTRILAPFAETDYTIGNLLVNLGVRFEYASVEVLYNAEDGSYSKSELPSADLFPTINLKYTLNEPMALRFGASRTITRPSYFEMADFVYEPEYGGDEIQGYADLENGYNYNIDLRYEYFRPRSNDMVSVTAYYKILLNPIEQVQSLNGSTVRQTFRNADDGIAAGIELEARKGFLEHFTAGFNASYMYTNVKLTDGIYTDTERMLQGASPYIINADITYNHKFDNDSSIAFALLYNLQGKRISSVGIKASSDPDAIGMANTMQEDYHTLNFTAGYTINSKWSVKLQLDNLLDSESRYTQQMQDGDIVTVKSYKEGRSVSLGASYKF